MPHGPCRCLLKYPRGCLAGESTGLRGGASNTPGGICPGGNPRLGGPAGESRAAPGRDPGQPKGHPGPAVRAGGQATYDRLLKEGGHGLDAALKAGRTVEDDDIAALTKALSGLTAPDARQVYGRLLAASERHQEAFGHRIGDEWVRRGSPG
ncbi:DUF2202 domain-containing protein [Streptomyces sp. NPDC101209]|uniref:DUF2202 domain-containing protein n=1 Tax=Streptomyces sp. NPDC101209 TaxID=3366129 RepID=UPI0038066362